MKMTDITILLYVDLGDLGDPKARLKAKKRPFQSRSFAI